MRIEDIESFRVLAETLNYTNAANRLYVTQSSLTRTIQQMEEELGFQLFDRSRRSVSLTAAGESFYRSSAAVLKSYADCLEQARLAESGRNGVIRFATHSFFINPVIFEMIERFQELHPDILLQILSSGTEEMIHDLNEGLIDCAVCTGRSPSRDTERIVLRHYRSCLVVAPGHPLADREEIRFEELKDERFAVIDRSRASRGYEEIREKARLAGFSPKLDEIADNVSHLLALIATGRYVSVLSDNYRPLAADRLVFIPLEDESTVDFAFLWKRGNTKPCVKTFADFIRSNYKRRVGDLS